MRGVRSPDRSRRAGRLAASPADELRNRLREVRQAAELTQASLAERTGITRQTIIAIERGGYVPSLALALALARELSTPVDELFWLGRAKGEEA